MSDHAAVIREALPALHQLGPTCRCKSCSAHAALAALVAERDEAREKARIDERQCDEMTEAAISANARAVAAEAGRDEALRDVETVGEDLDAMDDHRKAAEAERDKATVEWHRIRDLHGWAIKDLRAVVAERDRWRAVACNVKDGTAAAEAEVARLTRDRVVTKMNDTLVAEQAAAHAQADLVRLDFQFARLREAAFKVTTAYTAETEDHNDGEFALWKADDLVNAIVALRAALAKDKG